MKQLTKQKFEKAMKLKDFFFDKATVEWIEYSWNRITIDWYEITIFYSNIYDRTVEFRLYKEGTYDRIRNLDINYDDREKSYYIKAENKLFLEQLNTNNVNDDIDFFDELIRKYVNQFQSKEDVIMDIIKKDFDPRKLKEKQDKIKELQWEINEIENIAKKIWIKIK